MALRFITQARPEDLAAAQWALIAAVEETAGSLPVQVYDADRSAGGQ